MRVTLSRVLTLVAIIILCGAPAVRAQQLGDSLKIDRLEFPVTLSDGSSQTVVGYLYYHGAFENRPLQVLVHGATYNHAYWDFPTVNGRAYSYARYMAAPERKYAVLALDQLGAGESSRPAGSFVTLYETGSAIKQVIDQLRTGDNPLGYAFGRIVLVGHSAGSINAIYVQAMWHPADALVVTASRHSTSFDLSPGILAVAPYVPVLAGLPYFVLDPGFRRYLFYYEPAADPAVIAADNATADAWTSGQVLTTFMAFVYPIAPALGFPQVDDGTSRVTGPVLIQLGENDVLFPAASPSAETALWTSTVPAVQTIAGIGHDFNLHMNHEESWKGIASWLSDTLQWR